MTSSTLQLHDVDVPAFLKVLDQCEGNVFLVTREGDHLNLKSKLSQLVLSVKSRRTNPSFSASIFSERKKRNRQERIYRLGTIPPGKFFDTLAAREGGFFSTREHKEEHYWHTEKIREHLSGSLC
ncbi:hypothetical protein [Caproiciproducens sp. CPB-2]|uniref:hypothetical protein n=1 Tax=Caproiciproducens sp. CPB-2 TaxID=3030017 RepID=UPI0023DB5D05|nr:hypothetical protein [Caproiciproducens sp. CPB-2]MDF1496083.1 hypothetical protein [Caproiciproducens sp. CPB-2]